MPSDIQHFTCERIAVVCMNTFGRCSSAFLQGMVEGHPQVLTTPAFFWPKFVDIDNKNGKKQARDAISQFYNQYLLASASRVFCMDASKKLQHGAFEKAALDYLEYHGYDEKSFFFAMHWAYGKCLGISLDSITVIVYQTHDAINAKKLLRAQIVEKFLFTTRDPRSNFYSQFHPGNLVWTLLILTNLPEFRFYRKVKRRYPTCAIRHEDIHTNYPLARKKLMTFLGICDHASLQSSTMLGLPFYGIATSMTQIKSNVPNPAFVTEKWKKELPKYMVLRLEFIYGAFMREFNYAFAKRSELGDFFLVGPQKVFFSEFSGSKSLVKRSVYVVFCVLRLIPFIGYWLIINTYAALVVLLTYFQFL